MAKARARAHRAACATLSALALTACEPGTRQTPNAPITRMPDAVPGLDADQRLRFLEGSREFTEQETITEGLGPLFNGSACGQCHSSHGVGGAGPARVLHVRCRDTGEPDALAGSLMHLFSTRPDLASASVPRDCDAIQTERRTTSVLGAGLIEAVDDAQLLDEEARQSGGLGGRAARVFDVVDQEHRIGRFGWKAQQATLDSFAGEAYRNELGITNEYFPDEIAPGGDRELLSAIDPAPDPEARHGVVRSLANFMRYLAPPPGAATDASGLELFRTLGCEGCHRESYDLSNALPPFTSQVARMYSDLLLHDVGTGDGMAQGSAGADEIRTAPLWGLSRSPFYLHDGRALSIDDAITWHGGQAEAAKVAYEQLDETARERLLVFLSAL